MKLVWGWLPRCRRCYPCTHKVMPPPKTQARAQRIFQATHSLPCTRRPGWDRPARGVHQQQLGGNPLCSRLEKQLWGRNGSWCVVVGQGDRLGAMLPLLCHPRSLHLRSGACFDCGHHRTAISCRSPVHWCNEYASSLPLSAAAASASCPHPRLLTSPLELFQHPLAALSSAKRFLC